MDTIEFVSLLNSAMTRRVEQLDGIGSHWSVTLYLSGGPEGYSSTDDEWLTVYAGLEDNLIQIIYHSKKGEYSKLYCKDEALYQFVRGTYTTEEKIDKTAMERFGENEETAQANAHTTIVESFRDPS